MIGIRKSFLQHVENSVENFLENFFESLFEYKNAIKRDV